MIADKAGQLSLPDEDYAFHYSNYGYAVLGLILEHVYAEDYATLSTNL